MEKTSKVKHSNFCNKYENGGLKNVDIFLKSSVYNARR